MIYSKSNISDDLIVEAVKEFGTPLYLYDSAVIRNRWGYISSILNTETTELFYSVKANPNPQIIRLFGELGASFEVVSIGELQAVKNSGLITKLMFVGPGKSDIEIKAAIENNIYGIVAESKSEINKIDKLSQFLGSKKPRVFLRINPGRGKGIISMGGVTQFGMDKDTALDILANKDHLSLEIMGLHAYLGTGILDYADILENTELILNAADELQHLSGVHLETIDLGGGFGIPYFDGEYELDLDKLEEPLHHLFQSYEQKYPYTKYIFEAGRWLVGPAGIFITEVLDVKDNFNNTFVILNGGTSHFRIDSHYGGFRHTPVKVINKTGNESSVILCGPLCTSFDRMASNVILPLPQIGDIVAFYLAGAYGLTAAPGLFLSHGYPREVLWSGSEFKLIRDNICIT